MSIIEGLVDSRSLASSIQKTAKSKVIFEFEIDFDYKLGYCSVDLLMIVHEWTEASHFIHGL